MTRAGRAVTLAALGLILAACGSDDGSSSSATLPTPVPTSAAPAASTSGPSASDTTAAPGEPATTVSSDAPTTTPRPPLADVTVGIEEIASLDQPIAVTHRPGHDDLLYVAERPGRVRVLGGGTDEVVLDITDDTTTDSERGLLGLAFSPEGDHFYVSFTDDDGDTQIDEYGIVDDGTVDTNSRRTILQVDQPYGNHNGGHIAIGPDGYLYLGLGDGGAADDPERRALDPSTLLGKLVRIDPTQPSGDLAYTVPADNPFVGVEGVRPEIWSLGLRNPWRFSFDRATGDLWIGDVGQNVWEEIDHAPAADGAGRGISFGWSAFEGTHRFNDDQPETGHQAPFLEYEHGENGCSVTGGVVYRGTEIPGLVGAYLFGDYCSGKVWAVRPDAPEPVELTNLANLVGFGEDAAGHVYLVSLNGSVSRLVG